MASSKKAAEEFVERWKTKEGSEDREARSFWIELCGEVLGVANPTHVLDFERKVQGRRIDVFFEDMGVLIEHKSRGVSLDEPEQRGWINKAQGIPRMVTPFEQAKWYADNITPRSIAPKWVITCNFDELRIYDLEVEYAAENYETITLDELPKLTHRLSFITRKENSRLEREKQLSIRAGEVVGRLYDAFSTRYHDIENDEEEQRSLNILITRIVFLLYAEDAELLQERNAFYDYLKNFQVQHMRQALIDLFRVLKTPEDGRDPYLSPEVSAFPYVNGGLFEADIIIPQFDIKTHDILLNEASAEFDWSDISPTIFGAVFESTLNPETRRAGGMHYTSVENIHKVTGPLFYDALKDELTAIEGLKSQKEREFKLRAFRSKIASLKILDPACGSGNFLTETYLSLRKLENRVLENLYGGQMVMGLLDPIQVSIDQFYGIEINDFAVEVAKTALWIAELQMLDETREILNMWIDALPLKSNENIACDNALTVDWNQILPASICNYVIGNPPFISNMTKEQAKEAKSITGTGVLDYVSCWYYRFIEYARGTGATAALVSTNSICQGEQVEHLWKHVFDSGYEIAFAHQTFNWKSEATSQAHVHVVIVGIVPKGTAQSKMLYLYPDINGAPIGDRVKNINGYLQPYENFFVTKRTKPICNVPASKKGSSPTDDGNLIINTNEERERILSESPDMSRYVRAYYGAEEFLKGIERWCLWMVDYKEGDPCSPSVAKRLDDCRAYRQSRTRQQTFKARNTPWLFVENRQPSTNYMIIPRHSSAQRRWIPFGFVGPEVIASDATQVIPDADVYMFGILSSTMHNAWMRTVCGRIKSDYRYSVNVVYNNFVWPEPTEAERIEVEKSAQAVLDARRTHGDSSLADLYEPGEMPTDLFAAHQALDSAVEAAYGVDFNGDEEKIVAHLFKLYAEKTAQA